MPPKSKGRRDTDGGNTFSQGIDLGDLSSLPLVEPKPQQPPSPQPVEKEKKPASRGRLEMRREKAGRGGKTVTTICGHAWVTTTQREREELFATIRKRCACGGRLTADGFELQGDHRDAVENSLSAARFTVVRAGG